MCWKKTDALVKVGLCGNLLDAVFGYCISFYAPVCGIMIIEPGSRLKNNWVHNYPEPCQLGL